MEEIDQPKEKAKAKKKKTDFIFVHIVNFKQSIAKVNIVM
jgi:hypothetical protein